jgi:signal transduction histidine kinase
MCEAARLGDPPRGWPPEAMRELLMAVRTPGQLPSPEAEAQAAYGQIVCRALWSAEDRGTATGPYDAQAEQILLGYLENTLAELGPLEERALRILEDHLISADGSRTLRTENELASAVGVESVRPVLEALEAAAVLRAEEHQGSRYFELGHDWLAKHVYEQKQGRALAEARRREEEQRREQLARLRHIESVAVAVRTPLNDIIGYCELLMEEATENGSTHLATDLSRIEAAGRKLSALIDDIVAAAGA